VQPCGAAKKGTLVREKLASKGVMGQHFFIPNAAMAAPMPARLFQFAVEFLGKRVADLGLEGSWENRG
jgi:hypothetical protein